MPCPAPSPHPHPSSQVSFGMYDTEEEAARQYDRALVVEKGRSAKTNFPIASYEGEVEAFEAHQLST